MVIRLTSASVIISFENKTCLSCRAHKPSASICESSNDFSSLLGFHPSSSWREKWLIDVFLPKEKELAVFHVFFSFFFLHSLLRLLSFTRFFVAFLTFSSSLLNITCLSTVVYEATNRKTLKEGKGEIRCTTLHPIEERKRFSLFALELLLDFQINEAYKRELVMMLEIVFLLIPLVILKLVVSEFSSNLCVQCQTNKVKRLKRYISRKLLISVSSGRKKRTFFSRDYLYKSSLTITV